MAVAPTVEKATMMGLGCGVDATNPKLWSKKSAYQAWQGHENGDIIVLDEGGNWQSYKKSVSSQREMKGKLSSSLTSPQGVPIEIGVDAEMSRSTDFSRTAYGRKVVDYTVSINPDGPKNEAEKDRFEDRLSTWISGRIRSHSNTAELVAKLCDISTTERGWVDKIKDIRLDDDRIKILCITDPELALALQAADEVSKLDAKDDLKKIDNQELVANMCEEFVRHFRVTHYVSSLHLGAAEYQISEDDKSSWKMSSSAKFNAARIAKLSASAHSAWEKFSTSVETRRLGRLSTKGAVERMAVLGVEILPISDLVKPTNVQTRLALRQGLSQYMEDHHRNAQNQYLKGPFSITFEDDKLFYDLAVDRGSYLLEINPVGDTRLGSPFFLVTAEGGDENEFHIVYYGEQDQLLSEDGRLVPYTQSIIPYYLEANVNILGSTSSPLKLKPNPQNLSHASRFRLEPQFSHNSTCISSILQGDMLFYIRRPMRVGDSYVCATAKGRRNSSSRSFKTGCIGRKHAHNQWSCYMLFRLAVYKPTAPSPEPALFVEQFD